MNTLIAALVLVGAPAFALYLWIRVANSEQGERYLKQRMQGPFVPAETDEK